jgi:hypothetical protein
MSLLLLEEIGFPCSTREVNAFCCTNNVDDEDADDAKDIVGVVVVVTFDVSYNVLPPTLLRIAVCGMEAVYGLRVNWETRRRRIFPKDGSVRYKSHESARLQEVGDGDDNDNDNDCDGDNDGDNDDDTAPFRPSKLVIHRFPFDRTEDRPCTSFPFFLLDIP